MGIFGNKYASRIWKGGITTLPSNNKKLEVLMKLLTKILLPILALTLVFSCSKNEKKKIYVFHAGSLSIPFKQMETAFETKYPQYDILRESSGSRKAARKISDLHRECEVMASADYTVIDKILIADKFAKWNAKFATNEMAIMYNPKSKFANEINSKNWYEILQKKGVQYGHSDPNADPCGYRTMLVWQLAEKYYKNADLFNKLNKGCPLKNIRSAEVDLIGLLEAGELDYLFIYRSVAEQHHLPFVILPDEINLKSAKYKDFYKQATYDVNGKKPGEKITKTGKPMVYSITIPSTAKEIKGAELFVKFVLSAEGQKIMTDNGQPSINPAQITGEIPDFLK